MTTADYGFIVTPGASRIDQIKSVLHSSPYALSYDTLLNMDSSNLFYKVNFDLKC